jgi:hypothetical protein
MLNCLTIHRIESGADTGGEITLGPADKVGFFKRQLNVPRQAPKRYLLAAEPSDHPKLVASEPRNESIAVSR